MSLAEIVVIAIAAWVTLMILVVAMCRAAAHADSASDRMHALLH
jgi:hypothetical protein